MTIPPVTDWILQTITTNPQFIEMYSATYGANWDHRMVSERDLENPVVEHFDRKECQIAKQMVYRCVFCSCTIA